MHIFTNSKSTKNNIFLAHFGMKWMRRQQLSSEANFSTSTNIWLVEQTLPTLPYMDVHYATRSTTTRIFKPQSDHGWTSG